MTLTERDDLALTEAPTEFIPRLPAQPAGRWRGLGIGAAIVVVVAVLAQIPLINNHIFYYWDDSAAQFLPEWYRMGTELRAGHWPLLDPSMWMGGNIAAEAMFGLFNPVSLINFVLVSVLPDLAVAATIIKTEFLVVLAIGVYLLAREYGAKPWAAAVVATALPFTGYTLYFDAQSWVAGLMCFAWLPFVWWATRRYARGTLNPLVAVVFGFLAVTTGNPYGALGVIVVLLAVGIETLAQRHWRRFWGVVVVGATIGISTLAVFLPLVDSAAVTSRTASGVLNDWFNVPNLGDLIGLSSPTFQPQFRTFQPDSLTQVPGFVPGGSLTVPVFYVAWFLLPLAPWLAWPTLRQRLRERVGVAVFALAYLMLLVGPSQLWLFRWPARLTEYATLPIGIAFAIVLSRGIRTTRPLRRAVASAVLIGIGGYLAWASTPTPSKRHVAATLLVAALLAATILVSRWRPKYVAVVLVAGTGLTLGLQTMLYPANDNVTPWFFPHDVARMKATFATRYMGNTLEVGDLPDYAAHAPLAPGGAWEDVLLGNSIHVAGVDALNSYSGLSYTPFGDALCMTYYGGTCPDLYGRLWHNQSGTTTDLATILRLQTVVVATQPKPASPAPGWSIQQQTPIVTVYHRDAPPPWPTGRLSWSADAVTVRSDNATSTTEQTTYTGSGRVEFAALDWPGWHATVDGTTVAVQQGPAGVIQLDLPEAGPRGSTVTLSFTPPGFTTGIPLMIIALLFAVAHGIVWQFTRRKRRTS